MEEPTSAVDAVIVIVTLLIFFTPVVIAWLSRRSRNAMKKKLAEAMLALKQAEEKKREAEFLGFVFEG